MNTTNPNTKKIYNILRKKDKYICGICLKEHCSQLSATQCLINCLHNIIKTQPILQDNLSNTYNCSICNRKHQTPQNALKCAHACFKKLQQMHLTSTYLIIQLAKKKHPPQPKMTPIIKKDYYKKIS